MTLLDRIGDGKKLSFHHSVILAKIPSCAGMTRQGIAGSYRDPVTSDHRLRKEDAPNPQCVIRARGVSHGIHAESFRLNVRYPVDCSYRVIPTKIPACAGMTGEKAMLAVVALATASLF